MHYYAGESNVMNNQGGQDLKLFFIKSINDFSFYSLHALNIPASLQELNISSMVTSVG